MIITTGGTIIRMHADTISRIGRATRGVRVMNVKDNDEVATVDVTERDDEAETQAPEETAADLSPEELAEGMEAEVEETEEVVLDDEAEEPAIQDEE
jgi:DNA gyrase subunit A